MLYNDLKCPPYTSVILDSPDTVLIERAQGKRVDPTNGGKVSSWFSFTC